MQSDCISGGLQRKPIPKRQIFLRWTTASYLDAAVHASSGVSPFMMLTVREMRIHCDMVASNATVAKLDDLE